MNQFDSWRLSVLGVLSYLNTLEQNIDDPTLKLILECFIVWATKTHPGTDLENDLQTLVDKYNGACEKQGGPAYHAQRRIVRCLHEMEAEE